MGVRGAGGGGGGGGGAEGRGEVAEQTPSPVLRHPSSNHCHNWLHHSPGPRHSLSDQIAVRL